jgi:hypothetical protein
MPQVIIYENYLQIGHSRFPNNTLVYQIRTSDVIEISTVGSDKVLISSYWGEFTDRNNNKYTSIDLLLRDLLSNTKGVIERYTQIFDYNIFNNLIYQGEATPGSLTSDPVWSIKKFSYNLLGKITNVQYANGDINKINIWDDRASLVYS